MKDLHRNLFYSYSQGGYENVEEERVLENNLTKAFINTLEYSSYEVIRKFINEILDIDTEFTETEFDLQQFQNSKIKEKLNNQLSYFLLVISPNGKDDLITPQNDDIFKKANQKIKDLRKKENKKEIIFLRKNLNKISQAIRENKSQTKNIINTTNIVKEKLNIEVDFNQLTTSEIIGYLYELTFGSIPDAWILVDNNLILLENKLRGNVFQYQLDRHTRENIPSANYKDTKEIFLSWRDIYKLFFEIKHKHILLEQFLNYLEAINMGPIKFTELDFDSFYPSDEDQAKIHKETHNKLLSLVSDIKINNHNYKNDIKIKSPNFLKDYVGANLITSELSEKSISNIVHLSIGLHNDRMRIYITLNAIPLVVNFIDKFDNDNVFKAELEKALHNLKTLAFNTSPKILIEKKMHFHLGIEFYEISFLSDIKHLNNSLPMSIIELKNLVNKDNNKVLKNIYPDKKYKRSISGVFHIEYSLHSLFVMNLGEKIKDFATEALINLLPVYNLLSENLNQNKIE